LMVVAAFRNVIFRPSPADFENKFQIPVNPSQ
jgi:hypothetical protein